MNYQRLRPKRYNYIFYYLPSRKKCKWPKTTTGQVVTFPEEKNPIGSVVRDGQTSSYFVQMTQETPIPFSEIIFMDHKTFLHTFKTSCFEGEGDRRVVIYPLRIKGTPQNSCKQVLAQNIQTKKVQQERYNKINFKNISGGGFRLFGGEKMRERNGGGEDKNLLSKIYP